MKQTLSFILASVILLAACTKTSVAPQSVQSPAAASEDNSVATRPSNTELLTAHTWLFKKYYVDFVDSTNPGKLIYKLDGDHNKEDLSKNRIKYNTDLTFSQTDAAGSTVTGTWKFTDVDETIIAQTTTLGTETRTIVALGRKKYAYVNYATAEFALMSPAP